MAWLIGGVFAIMFFVTALRLVATFPLQIVGIIILAFGIIFYHDTEVAKRNVAVYDGHAQALLKCESEPTYQCREKAQERLSGRLERTWLFTINRDWARDQLK